MLSGTNYIPPRLPEYPEDKDELAILRAAAAGLHIVNVFGYHPNVAAAGDIWDGGGDYTGWPAGVPPETFEAVSTSGNDALGGAGARTVTVWYLDDQFKAYDDDGDPLVASISLNGTTPAQTLQTGMRILAAWVSSAGSGGTNAGDITLRWSTTSSVVFAVVKAGAGAAQVGAFTVPAGYTGYLKRYSAQVEDATGARAALEFKLHHWGTDVRQTLRPFYAARDAAHDRELFGGVRLTSRTDICLRAASVSAPCAVAAGFDLLLVEND